MSDHDYWQWISIVVIAVFLAVRSAINDHRAKVTRMSLDRAGRGYIKHDDQGRYR